MNLQNLNQNNRYSVLRIIEALSCWRALAVIGAGALSAVLIMAVGGALAKVHFVFAALFGLIAFVAYLAGVNGAGVCLLDLARAKPYRSVTQYLLTGVFSLPKLLLAALLVGLAYLAYMLVLAVVLVVCKIPFLGPILLTVAIPLLVAVTVLAIAGAYVTLSIVGPAIWDGQPVTRAISIAWAITRQHTFAVIGKIVGGLFLCGLLASMIFGLVFSASMSVGLLAVPILGVGMEFPSLQGLMGMGMGTGISGHFVAAGIGFGMVFAVTGALVFLMPLFVGVLSWCDFSEKVNLTLAGSSLDGALDKAKAKVKEMQEKHQAQVAAPTPELAPAPTPAHAQPTMHAPAQAPVPFPVVPAAALPATSPEPAGLTCPACQGSIEEGDRFCEHCGHKLF